jgi:hypothetical protein
MAKVQGFDSEKSNQPVLANSTPSHQFVGKVVGKRSSLW